MTCRNCESGGHPSFCPPSCSRPPRCPAAVVCGEPGSGEDPDSETERCTLPEGHEGDHESDGYMWSHNCAGEKAPAMLTPAEAAKWERFPPPPGTPGSASWWPTPPAGQLEPAPVPAILPHVAAYAAGLATAWRAGVGRPLTDAVWASIAVTVLAAMGAEHAPQPLARAAMAWAKENLPDEFLNALGGRW